MGLKMIFYLTNVTNAVNLSQPSVCIGGGLHAPSFRTALSKPRNLSWGKGADLTPPKISSLASPHRPKASDGSLEPSRREYLEV